MFGLDGWISIVLTVIVAIIVVVPGTALVCIIHREGKIDKDRWWEDMPDCPAIREKVKKYIEG